MAEFVGEQQRSFPVAESCEQFSGEDQQDPPRPVPEQRRDPGVYGSDGRSTSLQPERRSPGQPLEIYPCPPDFDLDDTIGFNV